MKRKFYYAWAFTLLCSFGTNAMAQTAPRPALFGIDINAATQQRIPDNKNRQSATPVGTTTMSVAKAHVVPAPKSEERTINVLTGYKEYDSEDNCTENCTYKYDEKGRLIVKDSERGRYEYTYKDNAAGEWTEKLMVFTYDGFKSQYLDKREFDSQGRIIAELRYEDPAAEGQWKLTYETNYAYTDSGECIRTRYLLDTCLPSENKTIWSGYVLTWYEPIHDYIRDDYDTDAYSETIIEGDICTTNYYKLKSAGGVKDGFYLYKTWSRSSTDKDLMTNQYEWSNLYSYYMMLTYNADGTTTGRDGYKVEYEKDTPVSGYTRKTEYGSYSWMDEMWTLASRYSYTNGFYENQLNADGFRETICEGYNTFEGWKLQYKERYDAVPCVIDGISMQKRTYTSYDENGEAAYTESRNIFYNTSDYSQVFNVYLYDNNNYVIGNRDGDDYYVYVFYDSNGNELKRLRKVGYLSSAKPDSKSWMEELKDGVWTKITNEMVVIGENDNKLVIQFDESGNTTFEESYIYGKLSSRIEYTYTDNGYTATSYSVTGDGELYKRGQEEAYISSDNVVTRTYVSHQSDGKIAWGTKTVTYPNGLVKNYYMNTEDGTFVFSNKTIPDNVSTDDHGYITTIQYAVDNQDNEDFEEVKKTVILRGANHYDCEEYVKQDGKWVGTYKDELILLPYPYFDVQYMSDPDAFVTKWESFIDFTNSIHIFYAWDKDNDKWVMDIGRVIEYAVNDNTLEFKRKEYNRDYDKEVLGIVKRDDAYHIIEMSKVDKNIYPNGDTEIVELSKYAYTYNDDGKLTEWKIYNNDKLTTRRVYTYGDIVVTDVEHIADGTTYKLRISRREITAGGKLAITLYDMSGRVVAHGSDGKVVAPADGMYVAAVGGKNIKIVVNAK